MKANQLPTKFPIPFGFAAAAGTIRTVPFASQPQVGSTLGAASFSDGFPVVTGQPLASGGVPPSMQDFNGILNEITAWQLWQALGGTVTYDGTFATNTNVNGYPIGAILASTAPGTLWFNTVDNNTSNPDTGGTGWINLYTSGNSNLTVGVRGAPVFNSSGTWTPPNGVYFALVELWGGGGGGGAGNGSGQSGGGGAGGSYSVAYVSVTPGTPVSFTIGGPGGGGSVGTGASANGTSGGTSSITIGGRTLTSPGGGGGQGGSQGALGGTPTTASGGDEVITGGQGGNYFNATIGGRGGESPRGGSGSGSGNNGNAPGGGGGGGSVSQNGPIGAGGRIRFIY